MNKVLHKLEMIQSKGPKDLKVGIIDLQAHFKVLLNNKVLINHQRIKEEE